MSMVYIFLVYLCRIAVSLLLVTHLLWSLCLCIRKKLISMKVEHLQMVSKSFNSVASKSIRIIHKCIIPRQILSLSLSDCVTIGYQNQPKSMANRISIANANGVWYCIYHFIEELICTFCWKIATKS